MTTLKLRTWHSIRQSKTVKCSFIKTSRIISSTWPTAKVKHFLIAQWRKKNDRLSRAWTKEASTILISTLAVKAPTQSSSNQSNHLRTFSAHLVTGIQRKMKTVKGRSKLKLREDRAFKTKIICSRDKLRSKWKIWVKR